MMTKIREGYKETEIGVIPEDWEVSKLSQILQNRSEKYTPNEDEDFPYVALEHIDQESGRLIGIGKSSESTSTKSAFYKNDVLFGKLRPYLRKYWLSDINGVCSTEILALKALTHPEFAFYTIQSNKFIEDISKKAFGTKMPRTSWADMKDYKIPLPTLPEQKRIAEILSTTDSHIEKLDKTIEDYQLLKKGMMKKLLTEGIGHTEFKETEIGRIPKEWEVKRVEEISEILDSKRKPLNSFERNAMRGNIPYYGANGVVDFVDSFLFDEDLILLAEDGGNFSDYANRPIAYRVSGKSWVNNHAHILKPLENVDFDWVFYSLQHKDITDFIQGGTRAKLNQKDLRRIMISIPPKKEQIIYSKVLTDIDERISLFSSERLDFIVFKKALMEKLLTGKIRIV